MNMHFLKVEEKGPSDHINSAAELRPNLFR